MKLPANIPGIGVDLCSISRMEKCFRGETFLSHVFSKAEQTLLSQLSPARRAQTAAANFAAKEAFLKAVGSGLGGFQLPEIEVLRRESGAPYIVLGGEAQRWANENQIQVRVSLTHEADLACAFVVLEQP